MAESFGDDLYYLEKSPRDMSLDNFCALMYSDMLSPNGRAVAAAIIVSGAMGLPLPETARTIAYGNHTLTLTSAAYVQSDGEFNISKNAEPVFDLGKYTNADGLSILCLLDCADECSADPTVVEQWKFYALSDIPADENISLSELMELNPDEADFDALRKVIGKKLFD